jgi:hypothetical protein
LARSPGIAWTRQVPLLALAGATSETTAQITTAALSTILSPVPPSRALSG